MRTVAAIDCGSNSVRLLVLQRVGDEITELVREVRVTRLAQGVDASGEFHPDALARTFAVCDEYAALIGRVGVDRVRFVATSAARDVRNRGTFADGVRGRLGVEPDVIAGAEEARLSAAGVLAGVTAPSPVLVVDIGGGSTELVTTIDGAIAHAISLDIGAVRLKERFLHNDPPTAAQITAARRFAGDLLERSGTDFSRIATAVGVAGTVTSVAARVLGLTEYSREAVHGTVLTGEQIAASTWHWNRVPTAEIEQEPCMHPLRAGVIGAGALILEEISARVPGGRVLVSETDILDGIALELLN